MSAVIDPTNNAAPRSADLAEDEIDLSEYLATLIGAKWLIAGITAAVFFLAVLYAIAAKPIYRADALVQVEEKSSMMGGLNDLSALFSGKTPAETEIEIIRSRSVASGTVAALKLDIEASPKYFPIIGAAIARRHKGDDLSAPLLGLSSYAWGGERIKLERLDVPPELEGKPLTLVAAEAGRFIVLNQDGETLLQGEVGKAVRGAGPESISLFISELNARPGTEFKLTKSNAWHAVNNLNTRLKVAERGKKTGILEISIEDRNRVLATEIVNSIANTYLRQNVERRSAQAEQTLEFLNAQLPDLRANLEASEARLNEYQSRLGSIDLTLETQGILEQLALIERQLSELDLKRTELGEKFTANHPAVMTMEQKKQQLEADRASYEAKIRSMPAEVQESIRLTRDVKVANELYLLLLNKSQEMNVVKAGTIGNVRILDRAVIPQLPIKPKRLLIVIVGLVLGVALGVVVALLRKALNKGVEDPDVLEQQLGLPIFASIPHSNIQARFARDRKKKGRYQELLSITDTNDLAVESLRSLRTSLQFALMDGKNNLVSITGPSPGIGKSFVSANLAAILAEGGKRILLLDADMRKGHLHEYFGLKRTFGLSGLISGEIGIEQAIRDTPIENLKFLPAGIVPPNPAELLMSDRFQQILAELSEQYDLVVIDTPPILAVTDAAIVGRLTGINFVVVKSGFHPMREIQQTVKRMRQNGVKPQGFIFNDIPPQSSRYGRYGQYGYHYQYSYK